MTIRNLQVPLTAAALVVLLAACGSGSGTGDTGGAGGTSGTSVAPKNAGAVEAGNASASIKAPSDAQDPLIDSTGIRGDLLLSMLDHRTCHHRVLESASSYNGPAISNSQPELIAQSGLESPVNYQLLPGVQAPLGPARGSPYFDGYCLDDYFRHVDVNDGSHTLGVRLFVPATFGPGADRPKQLPFRSTSFSVPLTVSGGKTVTLGAEQKLRQHDLDLTLASANAHTFQTDARIPYGLVTEWRQGDSFTELMVLPGDNDKQAKLCWNTHTAQARQLYCQVWSTPDGWQRGGGTLNLDDQYVVDDRAMYEGESGHLYWRGNTEAPAPAANTAPAGVVGTVPTEDARMAPGSTVTAPAAAPAAEAAPAS